MGARDERYRGFVRGEPCLCQPCATPPEFHHMTHAPVYAPGERRPKHLRGARGKGQTAADYYGLPLCPRHHGQRHRLTGYFSDWTREELRSWERTEHVRLRSKYDGGAGEPTMQRFMKRVTQLDVDVSAFIKNSDLSPQLAHELKLLIDRAKKQGRDEERHSGRRPA